MTDSYLLSRPQNLCSVSSRRLQTASVASLGGIRWTTYARNHHRFADCRFPVGCQRQELEVSAIGSELFLTREADKMYLKRDIWRILLPRANHLLNGAAIFPHDSGRLSLIGFEFSNGT